MNSGILELKRKEKKFKAGFCILNEELQSLSKMLHFLHKTELRYYDSLKFEKRKISYLLGRIAAKKAISKVIQIQSNLISIDFGIFNFPVVKSDSNKNIQISISHCDNIGIALAFPEEHPMGIDIERINDNKIDSFASIISSKELELINTFNDINLSVSSTIIWTIKEGLSKIFRTGLMMDFRIIEIESLDKMGKYYVSTFHHVAQYKAISYHYNDYICSIVLPKKTTVNLDHLFENFTNTFTQ